MNLKTSTIIWTFIWCIFMGITVGSIGIGAVFPSANLIAKPFVCPGGNMQNSSDFYQVSPVESVTTITWYCVDGKTGAKTELGIFPMSLYAGAIYGLLFFIVVLIGMIIVNRNKRSSDSTDYTPRARSFIRQVPPTVTDDRALRELKIEELRHLRDSNKISEEEYMRRAQSLLPK